jgi:hypothetical protein
LSLPHRGSLRDALHIAVVLDGVRYLGEDCLDDVIARGQPLTGVCLPLVIDGDVARA